jgi:hypothetical protein
MSGSHTIKTGPDEAMAPFIMAGEVLGRIMEAMPGSEIRLEAIDGPAWKFKYSWRLEHALGTFVFDYVVTECEMDVSPYLSIVADGIVQYWFKLRDNSIGRCRQAMKLVEGSSPELTCAICGSKLDLASFGRFICPNC